MPLLQISDKIVNTDQIISVQYYPLGSGRKQASLQITFTDEGSEHKGANFMMFNGNEAEALWSTLSDLSQKVIVPR